MVSTNVEHHFIPACDLTPTNLMSAGQFCVILKGKLASQIHWVKKCQSKKAPKGVELEDGTKLPFGDVCQVMPMSSHSIVGHQLGIIAGFSYAHLISFTHPQHWCVQVQSSIHMYLVVCPRIIMSCDWHVNADFPHQSLLFFYGGQGESAICQITQQNTT
ncbi:hypothetical protein EDD16DRAFT_1520800 [Pisolithus croceorrhizus]|nr:hypothetical protein EDD16DRAFT_1520800 [Pisolithus croceorrhizus]KAI6154436.1 hypothetical protein EDD17DRAFT_1512857 [Pisolithus thermaeus]